MRDYCYLHNIKSLELRTNNRTIMQAEIIGGGYCKLSATSTFTYDMEHRRKKHLCSLSRIVSEWLTVFPIKRGSRESSMKMDKNFSRDMDVLGYEINKGWWTSRYSIPMFIDLIYCNQESNPELNPKYALLFCYFNDGEAFRKYVRGYRGSLIFIIGPGEGKGIHTEPQPFKPDFENNNWMLLDYQEVKNTKDFIAAYIRNEKD
ncbi:hypothetical protein Trydic_g5421 [Trypoxylus dichotomus]